jgi:hypothetical protein
LLNDHWVIKEVREEIKSFLEANENENISCQNLWDTAKAVIKGKFIAMSKYIKRTERTQINYIMLHLKTWKTRTSKTPSKQKERNNKNKG